VSDTRPVAVLGRTIGRPPPPARADVASEYKERLPSFSVGRLEDLWVDPLNSFAGV
jgi:hypothetical protein